MAEKQFIGVAKAIPTQYGEMLKHSFPIEEMKQLIAQQEAKGEKWMHVSFGKRKEVSAKGYTHSAWLDEYKPDNTSSQSPSPQQSSSQQPPSDGMDNDDDDIPF